MKTTIAATAAVKLEIYIKLQIFKILSIVVHSFSKDT